MTDSNASDTPQRRVVADDLYRDRGPQEASSRCDANTKYGSLDLGAELLRLLQLQPGETVIDNACGSGQHVVRFAEVVGSDGTARGFDFSEQAVGNARARGVRADVADGAKLPLDDASVDAMTCNFACYYFPDLDAAIAEWRRVMRPGGRVVVTGPGEGTNEELYEFHRKLTGNGPADVDLLSIGYVAKRVPPAFTANGFGDVELHELTNPIAFPTADEFIDYWTNTSLFARGVPEDRRQETIDRGRAELAGQTGPFIVTKKVAVAIARS